MDRVWPKMSRFELARVVVTTVAVDKAVTVDEVRYVGMHRAEQQHTEANAEQSELKHGGRESS